MSLLDKFFQPKSPVDSNRLTGPDDSASTQNADYRLDLTLQNLLSIGSEFSPDDIILLRKRARYGDPRWLYSLYDEMMRLGPAPQVLKAREAIKATESIWSATPEEADEDENSTDPEDKAARLIRDVTEEAWGNFLPDLKSHLSTKFFYGIAAAQVMWKPLAIEGKWSKVTDIRPIPARRFRLDPQTMRFKFLTNPYSWEGPFVDDLQKSGKLIFVEVGADTEPLDQRGLLYQCLIPWAIEQFTVRWRAKRLQNFGMPPVMVTYPKGDPQNKAIADRLAEILSSGTRGSLPSDMKAELLAAPGAGSKGGDPYEANIEWCARQYDQTILGHSQVSGVQVGAGSRSSSGDAIGLFKDVTNSRAKELDGDIKLQCFYPYVSREFGPGWADDHCPEIVSRVQERDDPAKLSAVALALFQAGAAGSIAVEDLVERCSLKLAEDGETTLAGNVKGEVPAPAEVDAQNKANPPAPPPVQMVGPDGKPMLKGLPGGQAGGLPGKPGEATGAAGGGASIGGGIKADQDPVIKPSLGAVGKPGGAFASIGDFAPAAREVLRKRKGRRAVMEFYTKRQRFAAASVTGGKPVVTLVVLPQPEPGLTCLDARDIDPTHPRSFAVLDDMVKRSRRRTEAAAMTGEMEVTLGILNDKGLAEQLKAALVDAKFSVNVEREQRFWSEDQPRDESGRFAAAGAAEKASGPKEHAAAAAHHDAESKRAYAKGDNARGNAHYLAKGAHEIAAQHKTTVGEPYRKQRDYARSLSKAAHSGQYVHPTTGKVEQVFPPRKNFASEPLLFTAIEEVQSEGKKLKAAMQSRIAARVRERLKAQHAMAVAEVEHKLAKAD